MLFVGGQRWTVEAAASITAFAEANDIPVVHDWHAADRFPFAPPVNVGELGYGRTQMVAQMFAEADVLVAVGALPTDVPTDGFTLRQTPDAVNFLVNIDTSLRGRSGAVTEHLVATPVAFAEAVKGLDLGQCRRLGCLACPGPGRPRSLRRAAGFSRHCLQHGKEPRTCRW